MLEVWRDICGIYVLGVVLFLIDEDCSLAKAMIWPIRLTKDALKLVRK